MHTILNTMNGMRSGIESINPFGVSIMYRFSYRQGGHTRLPHFFRQGFTPRLPHFFRQGFTPPASTAVTPSGFRYFRNSAANKSFSFLAASNNKLSSVGTGTGLPLRRFNVSDEQASRSPLIVV